MIYYTGDMRGSAYEFTKFCYKMSLSESNIIVILGDVGANYYGGKRNREFKESIGRLRFTSRRDKAIYIIIDVLVTGSVKHIVALTQVAIYIIFSEQAIHFSAAQTAVFLIAFHAEHRKRQRLAHAITSA